MTDWPDLTIGGVTLFFAIKGFRNGFIAELAGPVAIAIAVFAAFRYPGSFDDAIGNVIRLGRGPAHAAGTLIFAVIVYAIVVMLAWILGRIASLPGVNVINGVAGAVVGAGKAVLALWVVLYVTLFFPLSADVRSALHNAPLVAMLVQSNAGVDDTVRKLLPWFMFPPLEPFFARHHA